MLCSESIIFYFGDCLLLCSLFSILFLKQKEVAALQLRFSFSPLPCVLVLWGILVPRQCEPANLPSFEKKQGEPDRGDSGVRMCACVCVVVC